MPPRFFQFYGWRQLGGNKAGRGRKRQRRECDRVVMEGWGVGGEGSKSVGGGSLEERIRKGLGKTERGVQHRDRL